MMKIVISTATTLMAAAVLMACNGSGVNSNDVTSSGSAPLAKAVCTNSNNWQSVGLGMSSSQVQERLGRPATIVVTTASTQYNYEQCRGFYFEPTTPTSSGTIKEQQGSIVITANQGVTAINSPAYISGSNCELDYYNHPSPDVVCREAGNPF
jgi:hypothetical protein